MISFLSKNIQRLLVFFFAAVSIMLVVMGVVRTKKPSDITPTPQPTPQSPVDTTGSVTTTGDGYQTPWGSATASVTVKAGKIIAVSMPAIPPSPPSVYAEPYLVDQALKAGSSNIQGVSGATYTSIAFKSSLESAIAKAGTQGQTLLPSATPTVTATPTAKPTVPRKYRDDDEGENDNWF